jgi:hypothetical protein
MNIEFSCAEKWLADRMFEDFFKLGSFGRRLFLHHSPPEKGSL